MSVNLFLYETLVHSIYLKKEFLLCLLFLFRVYIYRVGQHILRTFSRAL